MNIILTIAIVKFNDKPRIPLFTFGKIVNMCDGSGGAFVHFREQRVTLFVKRSQYVYAPSVSKVVVQ